MLQGEIENLRVHTQSLTSGLEEAQHNIDWMGRHLTAANARLQRLQEAVSHNTIGFTNGMHSNQS